MREGDAETIATYGLATTVGKTPRNGWVRGPRMGPTVVRVVRSEMALREQLVHEFGSTIRDDVPANEIFGFTAKNQDKPALRIDDGE